MEKPTEEDLKTLQDQLGRPPRDVLSIETRCPTGHPQVILVYPLLKDKGDLEPFPTVFWLTCPSLRDQLSTLEHNSWIGRLEVRLKQDEALRRTLWENHQAYITERWNLLTKEDRNQIAQKGWKPLYLDRGIGGIANWDHLKCLHLHYAHFLARKNVIGEWIHRNSPIISCS